MKIQFNDYYQQVWGDRWTQLETALRGESVYYELKGLLLKSYFLDEASNWAAEALAIEGHERILDMCAAPGGKCLALATRLKKEGRIVANDRSPARVHRLRQVLDTHLPTELRTQVEVTQGDAAARCRIEKSCYDKILLDAPCSSERHVIQSELHLGQWSPARTRHLAQNAYALLCSALIMIKPGGIVFYITCSLSPLENDGVIDRIFHKKKHCVENLRVELPLSEQTKWGRQILPDRAGGRGPIYISCLRRVV